MESDRLIWLIEYGWWLYAWWPMNVKRTQNGKREKWKLLATPIDQICKQRVSQKQGESEKKIIGTNEKWPKDRHGQDIKLCHSLHVHRQNQAAKYGDFQSSYKSKVNSCIFLFTLLIVIRSTIFFLILSLTRCDWFVWKNGNERLKWSEEWRRREKTR